MRKRAYYLPLIIIFSIIVLYIFANSSYSLPDVGNNLKVKMNETYSYQKDEIISSSSDYDINVTEDSETKIRTINFVNSNETSLKEITLFISSDPNSGNDNNNGLAPSKALATVNKAFELIENEYKNIDIVNIKVRYGTYYHQGSIIFFVREAYNIKQINIIGCHSASSDSNKPTFDGRDLDSDNNPYPIGDYPQFIRIVNTNSGNNITKSDFSFNAKNFKMQYYNNGFLLRGVSNSVFDKLDFHYIGDVYAYVLDKDLTNGRRRIGVGGIDLIVSSNNEIKNCSFEYLNNVAYPDNLNNHIHAVYISTYSNNNVIHDCFSKAIRPDPIRIRDNSNNNVVYNSTFVGTGKLAYMSELYFTGNIDPRYLSYNESPSEGNQIYNNNLYWNWSGNDENIILRYEDNSVIERYLNNVDQYLPYITEHDNHTFSLDRISLDSKNDTYYVGDKIDNICIKAWYGSATGERYIICDGFTISPKSFSTTGNQQLTITYGGKTLTVDVNVEQRSIESLTLVKPTKLKFAQNQEYLDLAGGYLKVSYNNGTKKTLPLDDEDITISGYDNTTVGNKTISVGYKGRTRTFTVTIFSEYNVVTFDTNGGNGTIDSQTIQYPNKVKKPTNPTKEGYTFKEWQLNGNTYDFSTIITENITLKAAWTPRTYTVTFNSNGGSNVESQTVIYNSTATKPTNPTKEGYTFKEWQLVGSAYDFSTPITGNITLKAKWDINKYTVTFNSNGGSNIASQTVNYNTTATKPTNPTKEGYTFKEWQLNGNTYDFSTPVTSNITLTAKWDINKYTVTFNSNGGSNVASQTVDYNSTATKPSNPTKTGYTFKEWQLAGNTYDFSTPITGNITLTAKWDINKYTVTFNSNGGSNVASQTVNYNSTVTKPTNPTKEGYTFKEWQLNGNTYDFSTPVTSNITLTAKWDQNIIIHDETLKELLEKNGYSVSGNYVFKIAIGTTISSLKTKLGNDVIIDTNTTIVSTGTIVKKGNESYYVVIKGDLNGDGKSNSGDLLQMRKYLLEEIELAGPYKEAGIIESKNEIKSLDLLRLRQYLLGEYTFK